MTVCSGFHVYDAIVMSHGNWWCLFWLIWIEGIKTYTQVPNTVSYDLQYRQIMGVATPPWLDMLLKTARLDKGYITMIQTAIIVIYLHLVHFVYLQKKLMNFSFCVCKLPINFYVISEIQPKRRFWNIIQCLFKFFQYWKSQNLNGSQLAEIKK